MQPFIGLTQLLKCGFEERLVLEFLARTQSCSSVQAHIHPYRCGSDLGCLIRDFNRDRNEPPIGLFRHTSSRDFACEAEVFRKMNSAEFGNPHVVILQLTLIIGQRKARFAFLLAFELRIVRLL